MLLTFLYFLLPPYKAKRKPKGRCGKSDCHCHRHQKELLTFNFELVTFNVMICFTF